MSREPFPTPYAGTYYPIYNKGVGAWIFPTASMPFDRVSALFIAFAHAYPLNPANFNQGAQLSLEQGQPLEPARVPLLTTVARQVNPGIKILVSLGWEHKDWTYISADLTGGVNNFPGSVVAFIRKYGLDGFDIDDEGIGGSSGTITQANFNAVIQNLRNALDAAGAQDHKPYYLTITPGFGTGEVTTDNMANFDLINAQNYGGSTPQDFIQIGYPAGRTAWGIETFNNNCTANYPTPSQYAGLAGIFNWTMSADSACNFQFTRQIANDVGYKPSSS